MFLHEEGILFAGDLVFNEADPYLGYGYAQELKERLGELELMETEIVVPGHGDPGGVDIIRSSREYIVDMERIIKDLKDAGGTAKDIDSFPMSDKYEDWIMGNFFYSNLKYLFNK